MIALAARLQPGTRVRVVEQLPMTDRCWTTALEGTLISDRQAPTGAWFAHSKDGRLWLDRVEVRLDDGEIVVCVLDDYSRVEAVDPTRSTAAASAGTRQGMKKASGSVHESEPEAGKRPPTDRSAPARRVESTTSGAASLLTIARRILLIVSVVSLVLTTAFVLTPRPDPFAPAAAFVVSHGLWSLLRRRTAGATAAPPRANRDDPEVDRLHRPDEDTREAVEARGLLTAAGIVFRLALYAVLLAGTLFDWTLAALGVLGMLLFMLLAGAPVWLAAVEDDEDDELERHHLRARSIR